MIIGKTSETLAGFPEGEKLEFTETCFPLVLLFKQSWVQLFDSFRVLVYVFAIINAYSFENLKPNWENQKEIWDNTLILWHTNWTSTLWGMLFLLWIVDSLLVRSIRESSHWDLIYLGPVAPYCHVIFSPSIVEANPREMHRVREGTSGRLWG